LTEDQQFPDILAVPLRPCVLDGVFFHHFPVLQAFQRETS
jgi:hypothetical protein